MARLRAVGKAQAGGHVGVDGGHKVHHLGSRQIQLQAALGIALGNLHRLAPQQGDVLHALAQLHRQAPAGVGRAAGKCAVQVGAAQQHACTVGVGDHVGDLPGGKVHTGVSRSHGPGIQAGEGKFKRGAFALAQAQAGGAPAAHGAVAHAVKAVVHGAAFHAAADRGVFHAGAYHHRLGHGAGTQQRAPSGGGACGAATGQLHGKAHLHGAGAHQLFTAAQVRAQQGAAHVFVLVVDACVRNQHRIGCAIGHSSLAVGGFQLGQDGGFANQAGHGAYSLVGFLGVDTGAGAGAAGAAGLAGGRV